MSENKKLSGAVYGQKTEVCTPKESSENLNFFFTGTLSSYSLTTTLTSECQDNSRPSTSDSSTSFILIQNLQDQTTPNHASKSDDNLGEPEVSRLSERSSQIEVGFDLSIVINDPVFGMLK